MRVATISCCLALLAAMTIGASWALAAPATMPAGTPSDLPPLADVPATQPTTQPVLGPLFSSQSAGIALQPPAGCKTIRRAGGDLVVQFVNEAAKLNLTVARQIFSQPIPLTLPPDAPGPAINGEKPKGLLEMSAGQLLMHAQGKVLRQDVMPIDTHDAGILIARATVGTQHQLVQEAIVQANTQLYYTITLTTPGQPFDAPTNQPDVNELAAAATFRAVLDSVQVYDLAKLRADQDDRLFRTRTLFVNWTEAKLRSVLIPEQWSRVLRDGKDIGYSYIVEETENRNSVPGVKIGIRSRTVPQVTHQIDGETWYHMSFDRKIENWSSIALFTSPDEKYHVTEFGSSEMRRKPIVDPTNTDRRETGDNTGTRLVDVYTLSVNRVNRKMTAPEVQRDLPPFYLPQALGELLPRLLPTNLPAGYLFASYMSGEGEVRLRYVDVGPLGTFKLNGKTIEAFPITDRIGLDGDTTTYYVDGNGRCLGSETMTVDDNGVKTTIAVLPTDETTLTKIWANPMLTRPPEDPVVPRE